MKHNIKTLALLILVSSPFAFAADRKVAQVPPDVECDVAEYLALDNGASKRGFDQTLKLSSDSSGRASASAAMSLKTDFKVNVSSVHRSNGSYQLRADIVSSGATISSGGKDALNLEYNSGPKMKKDTYTVTINCQAIP